MQLLEHAGLAGQMVAILRQELDSMVRVIYLLAHGPGHRDQLILASINGQKWLQENSCASVTDRKMVDLAQHLQGWTQCVYKFGCAFIHLSSLHDYADRDALANLPDQERAAILDHCRSYHGGPKADDAGFGDLVPFLPRVLKKISSNLECYLAMLENGEVCDLHEL